MLSIAIISRQKGNGDSKLLKLLDSLRDNYTNKIPFEVLVKFDDDDNCGEVIKEFLNYNFPIKYLIDSRGNGRIDLHISYNKLIPLADTRTTMFTTFADDFLVNPNWDSIIEETFKVINSDVFIIQTTHNPPASRKDYESEPFYMGYDLNRVEDITHLEIAPIFSKGLVYLCSGFGPVQFTDVWSYYIQRQLWDLYSIRIGYFTKERYVERISPQGAWRTEEQTNDKKGEDFKNFNFIKSPCFKEITKYQAGNIMRYLKDVK